MSGELERFDPAEQDGRIVYEHLHRYALCREFVTGRRVLDLACGTGYGTAILGTAAAKVTGLDISAAAIRAARKRHANENVNFVIGDCFDLPFDADSFDVVVANEMIEHVEDHNALLAEIRRVLSDKGLLLVSTPNKPVYNRYKAPNVFHVAEMEVSEFRKLLTDRFRHVRLTGTRMALLSVSYALERDEHNKSSNLDAARIHLATNASPGQPRVETGDLQLADPEYVLAMCSDAPLEDVALSSSIFFDERNDLWLEHEKIMAWASGLHEEDEVLREDVLRTRDLLEQARAHAAQLDAERADLGQRLEEIRASHANLGASLESERQSLVRETERVQREASTRLATLAKLLSGMGVNPVAPEDTEILSSLFQINELLVTERLQRAQADERNVQLGTRLLSLQNEASEAAEERTRLASQLAARDETVASELRRREELEAERDALAEEVRLAAEQLSGLRTESAERSELLASELRRREELEAERDALAEALQNERVRLAAMQKRVEELEFQLLKSATPSSDREKDLITASTADSRAASEEEPGNDLAASAGVGRAHLERLGASALATSGANRANIAQSDALSLLHRRTKALLAAAPAQIAGRIAPAPEVAPLPWHLRLLGKKRLLETNIFSNEWLARQDPRLADVSLKSFLADPQNHGRSPHPLFDPVYYMQVHPDVAASGISPLVHYVLHGWRERRDPHPLFANDWYLAQNPDVASSGLFNPLDHYLQYGWREGRRPNPLFDPRAYIERYPDVAEAEFEPLSHYIWHGQSEGRELGIYGLSRHAAEVVGETNALSLMSHLLNATSDQWQTRPEAPVREELVSMQEAKPVWPPLPVDDFWPAQRMRDFILDEYGEATLAPIWYLLSLMHRWEGRQSEFATSDDCSLLMERLKSRSQAAMRLSSGVPTASIIIPVYNNVLDTLLCLASLFEFDDPHSFEVIVADDGSSDATARLIPDIGGVVKYLRQPENFGFLENCNKAAETAIGRTLIFLNNDTIIFPRWLHGLLEPFERLTAIGLVGSKLLSWDGTLQEAGGIYWSDGSAWNFGRGQDARAPEFNYLKDTDYVSGASIAVPAKIWADVGGFDPKFAPAYCEDSDLAFRLRDRGFRTLYNPVSVVIHHEGRSHGRDVNSGIKAYQVRNMALLRERWSEVLEREHYPNAQNVFRARDRSFAKRHILVVDHYVIQPDRDAGSRSMYDIISALLDIGWSVTFWPDNLWRDPDYTALLQGMGVEVIYGPGYRNGFGKFLEDRPGLYDAVLLSRPHIADSYLDYLIAAQGAKIVYYGHDIHFERMAREALLKGTSVETHEITEMKALEIKVCSAVDVALFPSEEEAATMAPLVPSDTRTQAIPLYRFSDEHLAAARQRASTKAPRGDEPARLLFVGGFGHPPNEQGIKWFCEQIAPLLRDAGFQFILEIVGSKVTEDVRKLERSDVRVLGFVSDEQLKDLYRAADVVIAPLQFGAGVKGKVVEAMSEAVPVVTTSIGAQGIDPGGRALLLGESPEAFAQKVREAADWLQARHRVFVGIEMLQEKFSINSMRFALENALM